MQTKTKLLEDALTNRNQDIEMAEDNNQQLLILLEKYDQKLDELQEQSEMREIENMQLQEKVGKVTQFSTDAIPQKITFLEKLIERLRMTQLQIDANALY